LPELPEHYSKKLAKVVEDLVKPKKKKKRDRFTPEEIDKIRMAFLNFFVGVFQDYEKYVVQPQTGQFIKTVDGVSACFNFPKYKEETRTDQRAFFKHFLHMQMFTRLLERKLWASKNEDVIDVTFFDEHIRIKQARNRKTFKSVSNSHIISTIHPSIFKRLNLTNEYIYIVKQAR